MLKKYWFTAELNKKNLILGAFCGLYFITSNFPINADYKIIPV